MEMQIIAGNWRTVMVPVHQRLHRDGDSWARRDRPRPPSFPRTRESSGVGEREHWIPEPAPDLIRGRGCGAPWVVSESRR